MTKVKNRKGLSEKKLNIRDKERKKLNSFEMHVNRRKYSVVGMKLKTEKGLPGISRSRALQKRKATLMQEYKWINKKNTFLDRRIGEKDSAMTQEDKIMARFTAEQIKHHNKKSIFNLGDGEELTHRGETLSEIEKYDDPKSDDEYDEQDGNLDSDFVGEAHFGGGMLKKVDGEPKSRKDLIDQLIAESKRRKIEKQKMREETLDLTHKLDSEWKELLPLVTCATKTDKDIEFKKDPKSASYDILSNQLKFEARGKPMDRLKSEDEIAKEEKEKLEALEKERLDRMVGEKRKVSFKHRSADDLDDGFHLDMSDYVLKYNKDGLKVQAENEDSEAFLNSETKNNGGNESIVCDGYDEENGEEESEDEVEEGGVIEGSEGNDDEENSDHFSDLKESDESEEECHEGMENKKIIRRVIKSTNEARGKNATKHMECGGTDVTAAAGMEKELPYIFEIPNDYHSFEKLMADFDYNKHPLVIERMIKCNHPSLKMTNKDKLDTLFTYLLQHLEDSACETTPEVNCFLVLDKISCFLHDLAQWNSDTSASSILTVIKEKYSDFLKRKNVYPGIDTLIFIKLVSVLFSTSDYRHKVVTPTLVFMEHMLASCRILNSVDISVGLFISTLILEFSSFSKRVVPEVLHFLRGVLRLCHPKESKIPIYLPFRLHDFEKFNLIPRDKSRACSCEKLGVKELTENDNSEEFKVKAITLTLNILNELCDLLGDKLGAILLFEGFIPLLDREILNSCLTSKVEEVLGKIKAMSERPLERLVLERKRPRPLKLYEPRIEEIYCLKRNKPMGKEKQERAKLRHKYKKEMKGALREIRKDASFLAKIKFNEIQKSDNERRRKVREILGSVAEQTGEVRKLKRKKKLLAC